MKGKSKIKLQNAKNGGQFTAEIAENAEGKLE
jgi:hypothetical protein